MGQVGVGLNINQIRLSMSLEVKSGHYLAQFIWKVDQKWN